jgi:NAD(P)-dependent dehydrogenase (short-subunit alcohol dehydrogenase family)
VSGNPGLDGAAAVVTGAAQGLGLAIAWRLAEAGVRVVLADRQEDKAAEAAAALIAEGLTASSACVDVTQAESVNDLLQRSAALHGRLDIVVNSAGVGQHLAPIADLDEAEWARTLAVNLTGTFLVCRAAARIMSAQQSGAIVNLASINGENPAPMAAAYNASKAGVISLTKTLAIELAPDGVRVNAVSPGPVPTEFNEAVMAQRAEMQGITSAEMVERIRAAIPLGRWGEPGDIAGGVVFLCSRDAAWITGEVLRISGGLSGVSSPPPRRAVRA